MKKALFIFMILGVALGCTNMHIYTNTDKKTNFGLYKTFAWTPQQHVHLHKNIKFDNDIIESNIQQNVMDEMRKRGFTLDTSSPDLILEYDIMTAKRVRQEQEPVYGNRTVYYQQFNRYSRNYRYNNNFYNYGGWNSYYPANYTSVIGYKNVDIPYVEGTLIIDIVDTKANKLIWKGYAIGEVNDPEAFEAELPRDIHKMFKQFPKKPIKK